MARLGRQTDPETREFVVDVRLCELPANWTIGQRAEVYIETGCVANALMLPSQFLLWRDGQPGVLVNDRSRASWRPVKLGLRGRESFEVTSGLTAGDQAVAQITGADALSLEGRRLRLRPAEARSSIPSTR